MKEWEKFTSREGGEPEDDAVRNTNQSELARSQLRLETGRRFPTLRLCHHLGAYKGSKITLGCYAPVC